MADRSELALSELLDRALAKGVVLWGDATISVAGVDLVYVGLKLLVTSVETAEGLRNPGAAGRAVEVSAEEAEP